MALPPRLLLTLALAVAAAGGRSSAQALGYGIPATDTSRATTSAPDRRAPSTALPVGASIGGFLSSRGLPPRPGRLVVTDTGLVFFSADGRLARTYPLIGPRRRHNGVELRASAVSLAYTDSALGRPVWLFRVDGAVFGTDKPGALLDLSGRPHWLDSLESREWRTDRPLVNPADQAATWLVVRSTERSAFADTLYALFGRPARSVGLVSPRGQRAGRLGEYIASRDSLALDPAHMNSDEQLRHAMTHELAHRWQSRAPGQLRTLWSGVGRIRDNRRYGHDKVSEHQAEAAAFAVHFLQTTAASGNPGHLSLLDQYELLVPGTRTLTRYFALQPIYAGHPLRRVLTISSTD